MQKITIGIATRISNQKRRDYLYENIDAILAQSNPNWELILSDDNSPLDVEWNKNNDPRITVFHHPKPLGIFGNFNFCLQNTKTDLFFPLGDDDLIDKDFVEKTLSYFQQDEKDTDLLCFNFSCMKASGEIYDSSNIHETFHSKGIDALNHSIQKVYSGGYLRMMFHSVGKTEKLKQIGGYPDYGMITDGLLNYLFPLNFNIGFLEDFLIRIRHHDLNHGGINNVDTLRKEKIELNKYIDTNFKDMLTSENKELFEMENRRLHTDHVHLLIEFKERGRLSGVREFFVHKSSLRNITICIFGIIFGKNIHKYFIFFTKYYTEVRYKFLSFFKH